MAGRGLMVGRKPRYRLHSVAVDPDPDLPPPAKGAGKMAYEGKGRSEAVLSNTSAAKPGHRQARKYAKAALRDRKKGRRRGLLASVDMPDALPPGSSIHLEFPLVSVNGKKPRRGLLGGGFIRIEDDGRMQFDGT